MEQLEQPLIIPPFGTKDESASDSLALEVRLLAEKRLFEDPEKSIPQTVDVIEKSDRIVVDVQGLVLEEGEKEREGRLIQEDDTVECMTVTRVGLEEADTRRWLLEVEELEQNLAIPFREVFECPVCWLRIQPSEGVILRDCLHTFCRECLIQVVLNSEDVEVKCPFRGQDFACGSAVQQREVKGLMSEDMFDKYLLRSLALGETQVTNSFHCKTPDCIAWCELDMGCEPVATFDCPLCSGSNCLKCEAIHANLTCQQFLEQQQQQTAHREALEKSDEYIQKLISSKEAMLCSKCGAVVDKIDGCDGLNCLLCKTALCWATKGPRWGPQGEGDTSGGCKCGENDQLCTPSCQNCH
jgi:RanBP-type and C3HC4-type zinc finger-containing protein 1